MKQKGMSQVLALIVAASVLMMTALTVIFMVTGTAGDTGQQTKIGACQGTINSMCPSGSTEEHNYIPATCQGIKEQNYGQVAGLTSEGVRCSEVS